MVPSKAKIAPIEVSGDRGKPNKIVDTDDDVKNLNIKKLEAVRPVFQPNSGAVTAPNASPTNQ